MLKQISVKLAPVLFHPIRQVHAFIPGLYHQRQYLLSAQWGFNNQRLSIDSRNGLCLYAF
jgi:hypothetical protein